MTFAIFIFLVVALAMFTYILIYKHSINKRLEESREGIEPRHRAMMSPLKFACFLILSLLLAYILLITIAYAALSFRKSTGRSAGGESPKLSVRAYSSDYESVTELFDPTGDIPGYTREVIDGAGFRFTIYNSKTMGVDFPRMMIYAEYDGETGSEQTPYLVADYGYQMNMRGSKGTYYLDLKKQGQWLTVSGHSVEGHLDLNYYLLSGITETDGLPLDDLESLSEISGSYSIPISFDMETEDPVE